MELTTREYRVITINEDYDDAILCITNLDNTILKMVINQIYSDVENGISRSVEEIVNWWIDADLIPRDAMIKQLGGYQNDDLIEIKELNTQCIAYKEYLTVNVVKGDL